MTLQNYTNVSFEPFWLLILVLSVYGLGLCIIQLVFLHLRPKPPFPKSMFSAFTSGLLKGYKI